MLPYVQMLLCCQLLGIKPEFFDFLKNQCRGIVIESYGSGGIPFQGRNILEKLNELVQCGTSVVITTNA